MASIRWKPAKKTVPGVRGGKNFKWHARVAERVKLDPNDVWQQMFAAYNIDPVTAEAAINAYFMVMIRFAEYGSIIPAGRWGRFEVTLQSEGVDDPKKLISEHIKGKRLNFYPTPFLKNEINRLDVDKIEKVYKKYNLDQMKDEITSNVKGKK